VKSPNTDNGFDVEPMPKKVISDVSPLIASAIRMDENIPVMVVFASMTTA
jgi:hypothetical protein